MRNEERKENLVVFWIVAFLTGAPFVLSFIFSIVGLLSSFAAHPLLVVMAALLVIPWNFAALFIVYDRLSEKYHAIVDQLDI